MDDLLITDWNPEPEIKAMLLAHPVHKRKAEGDGYEFYGNELRLAKMLGTAVANVTKAALKEFDKITGLDGTPVDFARKNTKPFALAQALERLTPILRGAWTMGTDKSVTKIIDALTSQGALRGGDYAAFKRLPTRLSIEEGMVASAKYYTNNYFTRIVLPAMVGDINAKIASGEPFDDTFFRELRASMDKRLKSVPYWRTVANQAASRSYHYGMTRAGLAAGYTGYRFTAVLDEKTSDVCRHMHGKTFWLADAVSLLEKAARIPPEEAKEAMPWATMATIKDMDNSMLAASGFMVPPLHGHCRSTIQLTR